MRGKILIVTSLLAVGAVVLLFLPGCESPAAQRKHAEASRLMAAAQSYEIRQQAKTEAAGERAAVRQMERDASHQRALDALPYVLSILGAGVVFTLLVLAFWDLRGLRQAGGGNGAILAYLDRLQLDQAQRDRDLWRAIATMDRRSLAPGDKSREVVLYQDKQR